MEDSVHKTFVLSFPLSSHSYQEPQRNSSLSFANTAGSMFRQAALGKDGVRNTLFVCPFVRLHLLAWCHAAVITVLPALRCTVVGMCLAFLPCAIVIVHFFLSWQTCTDSHLSNMILDICLGYNPAL